MNRPDGQREVYYLGGCADLTKMIKAEPLPDIDQIIVKPRMTRISNLMRAPKATVCRVDFQYYRRVDLHCVGGDGPIVYVYDPSIGEEGC